MGDLSRVGHGGGFRGYKIFWRAFVSKMRKKKLSVRIQKNSAPNRISALSTANFNILHFYPENDFKLISSGRKKKRNNC